MNEEFMTVKEVAEFIKASEIWIRKLVSAGKIPSYKIGRKRLFLKSDIVKWIKKGAGEMKN